MAASILLHLGLVFALAKFATTPRPTGEEAEGQSFQVRVVMRGPRITELHGESQEEEPDDDLVEADKIAVTESVDIPPPPEVIETPAPEPQETSLADTRVNRDATIGDEIGEPSEPSVDIARLQDSIRSTASLHRSEALDQQMDACREYRERHARWDCPKGKEGKTEMQEAIDSRMKATFRAWTYGLSENERISRELLADMDALRPMLDDTSVLGEVARTRYYLKAEQYSVMNPPGSQNGTVTILTLTPGGLLILNGWMTIGFNGQIRGRGPARDFGYEDNEEE